MFIQKLLRFQTIPGPYLGSDKFLPKSSSQTFAPLLAPKCEPPVLKSLTQQLDLRVQFQNKPVLTPPSPELMSPESSKLCKLTLKNLQSHPVQVREKQPEVVLDILEVSQSEETIEIQKEVLLSFLALEKPLEKRNAKPTRKVPKGIPFLDFHFSWEDELPETENPESETEMSSGFA
ncbi:hypothetical protein COW36_22615 [bacterium (Candidatus Blackallbacteria) CG17_big_fil_post_rev_8_21_14_2_50_48_46]|uniref:Uncharacterized protein n=1 Tax=bacterium (Candidatus Blackallbacteria) CG17_big_fil_post_rev_8_21_14_2_50_48_46 TaxID=2014261 RepID=A0A2M7FXY2_9BACT|nr:MAG: hypothetical protein COW64_07385 [bacterium (Candidatus Blackallbacteria) CG18_big_fil_WC_8_21_14_2_50_49_26]PIW14172.1 MAG: hypothetical protein COW36_22615 [bacterium (Candidatus Blackallbacteria) CG17_big_fil_post_rev_8_21_14_2_50_48_46]PIW46713.1 MAG: hypothetical protein COW20_14890 [bacterium (Candidatus Blackallbacteria) CG13_big_fil_rev_8_21_14_2_50_49_14]